MRVVIRTHVLAPQFEALAARHGVESVVVADSESMHRELADADALWTWPAFYDARLVPVLERHARRLRWVQLPTMGYDPVELHGVPPGVTVTSAGDAYAPTVAEHAVAMLLALVRHIPEAVRNAAGGTLGSVQRRAHRHAARRDRRGDRLRQHRARSRRAAARFRRARDRRDAQRPGGPARRRGRLERCSCSTCWAAATRSSSPCR